MKDYLLASNQLGKVLATYRRVLGPEKVVEDEQSSIQSRLRLAGLVRAKGGELKPRNIICELILDFRFVEAEEVAVYASRKEPAEDA